MANPINWNRELSDEDSDEDSGVSPTNPASTTDNTEPSSEPSVTDVEAGPSTSVFGSSMDFSSASRACQWPTIDTAPAVKHFRVKRKLGDQSKHIMKFEKENCDEIFTKIGIKFSMKAKQLKRLAL